MRTHTDRCCRLPSSPPANTDHTHKWLLQARRSETTTHNAALLFFFSFASCSFLTQSSGTNYELTDGKGVTGVERRASEGASEGGFIYSGKRRRGRALQRRSQPSIPSADRKHICSRKKKHSLFVIIQFPGNRRHFDAHWTCASCDCAGRKR